MYVSFLSLNSGQFLVWSKKTLSNKNDSCNSKIALSFQELLMSVSSFYPLFHKTKLGLGVSHPDIFMTWVGGIDFLYRLSRKKNRVQLTTATHQPIFQHLSNILSHQNIDVYSIDDLPSSTKLALSGGGTVFCKTI